jgi:hypothetical protein
MGRYLLVSGGLLYWKLEKLEVGKITKIRKNAEIFHNLQLSR